MEQALNWLKQRGHLSRVRSIPLESSDAVVLAAPVEIARMRAEWRAAREAVEEHRHWPVLVSSWGPQLEPYVFRQDSDPLPIIASADRLDPSDCVAAIAAEEIATRPADYVSFRLAPYMESLERELDRTAQRVGDRPSRSDVAAALAADACGADLDRWLLDWEVDRGFDEMGTDPSGQLTDFEPEEGEVFLTLLPTRRSAETLAFIPFYAEDGVIGAEPERLCAIARGWEARFGAELVSHWGTMLQFDVKRPPRRISDAWDIALEQDTIASNATTSGGLSLRDLARALVDRTSWFLHERP